MDGNGDHISGPPSPKKNSVRDFSVSQYGNIASDGGCGVIRCGGGLSVVGRVYVSAIIDTCRRVEEIVREMGEHVDFTRWMLY